MKEYVLRGNYIGIRFHYSLLTPSKAVGEHEKTNSWLSSHEHATPSSHIVIPVYLSDLKT